VTKKATKVEPITSAERTALLERLWHAWASKLLEKIENTPASELEAATLNSAAKLLSDNRVNLDTLNKDQKQNGRSLAEDAKSLPVFDDPEEADDSLRASLNKPLPTPAWSEEALTSLKRIEEMDFDTSSKQSRA
jgi:hypothetical protein